MSGKRQQPPGMEMEPTAPEGNCGLSGTKGRPVKRVTPENLLVDPGGLGDGPFFFCPDPSCDVVYFSANGDETYEKSDLKVRVGLKETEDPVPVCYCFEFTRGNMRAEIERTGKTTIPQRIRDGISAHRCACEVKNPQGTCCLGNVIAEQRKLQNQLGHDLEGKLEG